MEEWALAQIMPWLLGGLILIIALSALRRPLKWAAKVLLRTGAALAVLALLGKLGGFLGLNLGVNLFNALVIGLLGAPGFGLLLLVGWALAI